MQGARRSSARNGGVAEEGVEQGAQVGVVDLAREVLEEAVELVEVAVGGRQERRRVGRLGAPDRAQLDLELVAEALDAAADGDQVAASNWPARKSASRNARAWIAPERSRSSTAR